MATDQPSGSDDPAQHHDRSAEQSHQHTSDHGNRPGQARAPAETRSRAEYAADARGAGWGDQTSRSGSQPPGRPGDAPARPDSGTGRGSSHRTVESDQRDKPSAHRPEQPGDRGQDRGPAETRSREAYGAEMHAHGWDSQRIGEGEQRSGKPSSHSQEQPGDRGATQHGTTGDVGRAEQADRPGAERAPQRDYPSGASPGPAAESGLTSPQNETHPQDRGTNEGTDGPDGHESRADAEESDGHDGAGDPSGIHSRDEPGISAETVASRDDAASSAADPGGFPERDTARPGDEPADLRRDLAGPAAQGDGDRDSAERVTVEGKVIEVTHNRADGIWIEGLPGEMPHRIGDVLASPHEDKRARGDRFFRKAVENADDLLDSAEKNINLGHDALQRPPTHTEIPVSVPSSGHEVPHHEIDAESVATAGLTVGVLCWAAGEWISRKMRGLDDAGHR